MIRHHIYLDTVAWKMYITGSGYDPVAPAHCALLVWPLSYSLVKRKVQTQLCSEHLCILGCHSMLLTCSSTVNLGKFSGEFQDPSAVHLIFVAVAAPGTSLYVD